VATGGREQTQETELIVLIAPGDRRQATPGYKGHREKIPGWPKAQDRSRKGKSGQSLCWGFPGQSTARQVGRSGLAILDNSGGLWAAGMASACPAMSPGVFRAKECHLLGRGTVGGGEA
jgi:hypothetical protein